MCNINDMRNRTLCFLVLIFIVVTSCCPCRKVQQTDERKDSVRVEYRVQTIVEHDTAYVTLPSQSSERETRDSVSYLHNDYAESTAKVLSGMLYHNLVLLKTPIAVPTERVVEYRDSIVYQDREHIKTEVVEVKKPLSTFVKIQIIGFWLLLVLVALWVWLRFRK